MPTELTTDYLLGHTLVINGVSWRVLEILPGRGLIRVSDDARRRGEFEYAVVLELIDRRLIDIF